MSGPTPSGRNPELFENLTRLQPPARREQRSIISNGVNLFCVAWILLQLVILCQENYCRKVIARI